MSASPPSLTAYDVSVLNAVTSKARSTLWIAREAQGRKFRDPVAYTEPQVRLVLRGLEHLGLVEEVPFGRWRKRVPHDQR
jgi:hypothetical protein